MKSKEIKSSELKDQKKSPVNNVESNQGVLELIEDSLGGVSGGVEYRGGSLDNYDHWYGKRKHIDK